MQTSKSVQACVIRHQFFFFWTKHKTIENGKFTCICRNPIASIKVGVWIAASRRNSIAFIVKIKESVINEVT
jgi:hypothetical protein